MFDLIEHPVNIKSVRDTTLVCFSKVQTLDCKNKKSSDTQIEKSQKLRRQICNFSFKKTISPKKIKRILIKKILKIKKNIQN